jgi:glycosyltransferase involved in cell wall biosynthesis
MNQSLLIVYSNLGLGGIPKQIVDIVNEMGKSRPTTTIYILLKKHRDFDLRTTITNPRVIIKDFYSWSPIDSAFLFMLWVWVLIFAQNPSAILSFISPYALTVLATKVLLFWRKTKIIIKEDHFTSTIIQSMALPNIQCLGIKVLYPLADIIITPTKAVKRDLIYSYHLPPKKIEIVQNWSTYAKTRLSGIKRIYDLIYIGRMDKTKNILPLIKIAHTIIKLDKPRLTFLLVGDGPDMPQCIEYISTHRLQNSISMLPPVPDVSAYLKKTKVLIFNPDMKTEGFPVSILDAMACGTVVITKKFSGIDDVINKTNGYTVSTDQEMKKNILSVLNHYTRQQSIIKLAKRHVWHHNSLDNIRSYMRFL